MGHYLSEFWSEEDEIAAQEDLRLKRLAKKVLQRKESEGTLADVVMHLISLQPYPKRIYKDLTTKYCKEE